MYKDLPVKIEKKIYRLRKIYMQREKERDIETFID